MDFLHGTWPPIIIAVALLIVLALLVLRPRQRVKLTDSAPARPHMVQKVPPEGRGIVGEAAAATSDVTGAIFRAPVHQQLDGAKLPTDDLCRLKGVGPKFADALHGLGFNRFDQIAALTPTEVERLDARLGTFAGRLSRDRIVEQADYLARDDIDGFEQRFGKL
jgi:predicted flap endonuclease-1-like 5' DNA nuclease